MFITVYRLCHTSFSSVRPIIEYIQIINCYCQGQVYCFHSLSES